MVEKPGADGPLVAVIHRERYKGKWSLPKGKLDEGESIWGAALREVKEETGCSAEIIGFAGISHYFHNQRPKFVVYWRMTAEQNCRFEKSEEVDQLEWLPPAEAKEKLSHSEEKQLISEIYEGKNCAGRNAMTITMATRWSRWLYRVFGSPQYDRLKNALDEFEVRLNYRIQSGGAANASDWISAALRCLCQARLALQEFALDSGWQNLHTAQSMEIWAYDHNEVLNERKRICEESKKKFGGWRKETIDKLLCCEPRVCDETSNPGDDYRRKRELYQAVLIKNEEFNNTYHKIRVRGRSLKIAFFVLATIVVTLPVLAAVRTNLWNYPAGWTLSWKSIAAIEFVGILGAAFSVASSLTRSTIDLTIPQQVLDGVITWMRPALGAASAVIACLLFQAGALPLLPRVNAGSSFALFVIALVAGYSERFILGAVEKMLPAD